MKEVLDIDLIRFTDDIYGEGYEYCIPCIELSDGRSLLDFITIYTRHDTIVSITGKNIYAFEDDIQDILPDATLHNPDIFHRDPHMPKLSGAAVGLDDYHIKHYHIMLSSKQTIKYILNRFDEVLGEFAISKDFKEEFLRCI